ncbi:MDR family MFS transporter [Rhodococcoides yunnanense]|uniref:MDR family MFS transporter n=1 Tax=Rhodococcoides yunnanense TaxID=278209 RepID=UPI000933B412|nr:MDR family MFS transporter [Rhodococcus yunnanensis]
MTSLTVSRNRILVVLVPLMLVLFISNLDQTIVATAIPSIGRDLGALESSSWIATSYLLTSAVSTLIFGKLGDMYGRKRIFQIAIVVFLLGSVLAGLSQSLVMLVIFRGLQGIGGGGLNSLVMAIVGEVIPARQRSKYQALTGIVATIALIAGPFLGGLFSDTLSWRWIFYINIPIGLVALVIIGLRVHLNTPNSTGRVDVWGGVLVTIGTAALLLFATDTAQWSLLILAVVGLGAFIVVESRAAEPITPLHLFRSSVFSISSVQFFVSTLVLFVGMLYVPLFLQSVQHYSAFVAGLFLIPQLVGLIVATAVAGPLISKTGHYKQYPIIGAVLTGVSMWFLSTVDAGTAAWAIIVPLVFAGAGIGLFVQVSLLAGQNAVDYRFLGVATGALNFFKSIGGALGAAVFGAILAASGGVASVGAYQEVFFWTVPFMALALVLGVLMKEKPLSEEMMLVADGSVEAKEY